MLFDYFSHKGKSDQLSHKSLFTDFAFTVGRPKNEDCILF